MRGLNSHVGIADQGLGEPTPLWEEHTENLDDHESLMTEIQLRRIVDRAALNKSEAVTDGDETMIKDGVTISEFSKESMHLGDSVLEKFKRIIFNTCDKCVGQDGVFPTKNGAPKIMTKFINNPYSHELLDEHKNGTKKLPSAKAMDWHGKTANAHVIRSFPQATPVVEPCPNPRWWCPSPTPGAFLG
jgi:hypothetical protein